METKYIFFLVLFSIQTIRAADTSNQSSKTSDFETVVKNEELGDRILDPKNYEKISRSPEFLNLNYSEILELLNSDIAVTSETIVFNSVKNWINHDNTSRMQYLDELSNFIRFENIPENILLSESRNFCSEKSSHKCHAKILSTLEQKEEYNIDNEPGNNRLRESYTTLMAVDIYNKSNTFEMFDLKNENWKEIKNFGCDRTRYSAVLLEDKVMLIGGVDTLGNATNAVQSYDLKTGTMENLSPMKYARYDLSTVEFNGRVYAIGGWDGIILFPNVEMWDPALKIWKEVSPMSIARKGCGIGVINGEIFVVGGYIEEHISDVESYNPVTDKWRKVASMNKKRDDLGVAVVGKYLYAVGGLSIYRDYLKTAEKYDPEIDRWTMIYSINKYSVEKSLGVANLFGKLVMVCRVEESFVEKTAMEMYDDENDKWISMPIYSKIRHRLNLIEIPWRLAKTTLSKESRE